MATVIETGGSAPQRPGARMLLGPDGTMVGTVGGGAVEHAIASALRRCRDGGSPSTLKLDLGELGMSCGGRMTVFVEPLESPPALVVFGAGHVAKATAPIARALGFLVTIVDERAELNTEERFPGCERIVEPIEESGPHLPGAGETASSPPWFLIMTHDHALDGLALQLCLDRPHAYVGLIGSHRKVLQILKRTPLPEGGLDRLYAPVGLDIGGSSPEELAVGVAAELLAVRHGKSAAHMSMVDDPRTARALVGELDPEAVAAEMRAETKGAGSGKKSR